MDSFSELIAAVQSDLTVGAESSLFDPTTIKLAINRAYRRIAGMFKWAETRDSLKTSTIANQEYYDYPQNWRSDSIWKLMVDGIDYGDPLALKDYLYEQDNDNPSGYTYLWANQRNRFFITPVPTVTGDNNILVWGHKVVDKLVNNTDVTIFSYNAPELNDAIVLEADAILKRKGDITQASKTSASSAGLISFEAATIVTRAWQKQIQENAKIEKTIPQFEIPDYFSDKGRNKVTRIGNF